MREFFTSKSLSVLDAIISISFGIFLWKATENWTWLPTIVFIPAMLIAYGILFRKPKTPGGEIR
jgi:hypothetical protein